METNNTDENIVDELTDVADADQPKGWVLSNDEKTAWCTQYESCTTGFPSFPSHCVPCTQCETAITMFGTNLRKRVKKFGSPRKLLDTFVCIRCVRKNKAKEPYALKQPTVKIEKNDTIQIVDIPKVNYTQHEGYSSEDLANNPDLCAKMTTGNCWKPQLYLDNDKRCNGPEGNCNLFTHCAAAIKR